MAKLCLSFRIFHNGQLVREEKLNQGVIKIGKVPSAHLRIDDEKVSRMHAIIEVLGTEVSVIDLGSTGGTFVNGHKVNKAKLQSGDTITVGDTLIEFATVDAAEQVTPSVVVAPALVAPIAPLRIAPPPTPPKLPTTTITSTPAPTMPMPMSTSTPSLNTTVQPATFQAAMATSVEETGARAIEVAAMLGDSVVGVKHCMNPRGGKITRATWGFAAGGLVCLLASATAFYTSVDTAASNKSALERHLKMNKPARSFRPAMTSTAVDLTAGIGLAFGIFGLTTALVRSRRERKSPFYRIGTASNVEQAVETAPSASFALVAPAGDDFVFNYAQGIEGEITTSDGKTTPLAELAAQGRARPSATIAGAIEVPIPMAAKIRAKTGQTTFLVSAVNKPREQGAPLFALERRVGAYVGGSLAAHLAAVLLLGAVDVEAGTINIEIGDSELTSLSARTSTNEDVPPEPEDPETGNDTGKEGSESAKMKLEEGAAGKPNATRTDGRMEVADNKKEPRLSREQAIEQASRAGFLGSTEVIRGGIAALTATDPFSSGFDQANIYGPLFGTSGEGRGNFGFGRNGFGVGGGCTQEPCGLVATGRYNTIPGGRGMGDSPWGGEGGWGGNRRRTGAVPKTTDIGMPTSGGNLDKTIIKRYIKRNQSKIAYCYESELMARPSIEGQVQVSFLISGTGSVMSSTGVGFDSKVASCVASVIKHIEFPRPTDGGNVQVNYPFTFHAVR
jgi:pSer/pThr/pTyr-binding forkhead associated (FHA) protein